MSANACMFVIMIGIVLSRILTIILGIMIGVVLLMQQVIFFACWGCPDIVTFLVRQGCPDIGVVLFLSFACNIVLPGLNPDRRRSTMVE